MHHSDNSGAPVDDKTTDKWIQDLFKRLSRPNSNSNSSIDQHTSPNGNNSLDPDVLDRHLAEKYHQFHSEDLASKVTQEIAAYNGRTDYASFKSYMHDTESKLKGSFERLDQNKNQGIDLQELKLGLQKLDIPIDDEEKVVKLFNLLDVDHDGSISYEDWRDRLAFIPNEYLSISPLKAAYLFFIDDMDLSAEGDVLLSSETSNGIGYFLSGGLAGVVSRSCTAPFDRIKVFLIAQSGRPASSAATAGAVTSSKPSIISVIRYLYAQGGLKAFFVGNGLNVVKVFPDSAMKFGSFEATKRMFCRLQGIQDPSDLSRTATFISGGIGGMVSQLTVYPIDTLKFRIQCSAQYSDLKGKDLLLHTFKETYKEGGIRTFYRGLYVGVLGIFPFAALDLGMFSLMKKTYIARQALKYNVDEADVKLGNLAVLTMGALSGSVGASVVYPVNLLRTRLQAQGTLGHPYHYDGFIDVFKKTVKRDGYLGLWRGLVPNLAKVAPALSISYVVYENSKAFLNLD